MIKAKFFKNNLNDPNYKGEDADIELENGPLAKRGCTDIICCILFLIYVAAMLGIFIYALTQGNPELLAAPVDSDAKACGYASENREGYPFIYFSNPVLDINLTVCVSECPAWNISDPELNSVDCMENSFVENCTEPSLKELIDLNIDFDWTNWENATVDFDFDLTPDNIPFFVYNTTLWFYRFCMPSDLVKMQSSFEKILNSTSIQKFEEYISDVVTAKFVILGSVGLALLLGVIYMLIIRCVAGIVIWSCIISFQAVLVIAGYFCFYVYGYYDDKVQEMDDAGIDSTQTSDYESRRTFYVLTIIFWTIAGIYFFVVLCMYHKIKFAVAIIKTAAQWIRNNPLVSLIPIVLAFITLIFYALWILTTVNLWSIGDRTKRDGIPFAEVQWSESNRGIIYFHFFGGLWINAFLLSFTQFVLASACCLWYFNQGPDGKGVLHRLPILTSVKRGLINHLGSIAFGALILAVVQAIRLILAYVHKQMKDKKVLDNNRFLKFLMGALQCLLACFERTIRYINKNAFIQVALTGKNFCVSAMAGFFLLIKNPFKFGLVHGFAEIFMFFGKIFITSISALCGYIILIYVPYYNERIYSPFLPTVIIIFLGYAIGTMFMSIYGIGADSIIQCYLLDEEIQEKKNGQPPVHCPSMLKEFFNKHKQNLFLL